MSRATHYRILLVVAAALLLEVLCRARIIDHLTIHGYRVVRQGLEPLFATYPAATSNLQ